MSDLHIGAPVKGTGIPKAQATEDAYSAIDQLQEQLLCSEAEAVLCAGDVFDRHDASERALARAEDLFASFHEAGLPTLVIGGNHDVESPLTEQLHLPGSARWVGRGPLGRDGSDTVLWHEMNIAVHGQGVRDRDELRDLGSGYPTPVSGMINIGLLHTSLTGEWSNRACAPTTVRALQEVQYDAWVLGHVHQPMVLSEAPLIAYPGSVHTHKAGEAGGEGYALLTLTPDAAPSLEFRSLQPQLQL
ncbi:exonuclease SbcCD subunit D [Nesterenkonia lacusekhoensis]